MQDKNVVRRRRAVFLLLALLSVVLITVAFGGVSGPLGVIQRGAQAVLSPIESGASIALKPIRDGINWVGDTFNAQAQNDELRAEVEGLRGELARAQTEAREAAELRAMVELADAEGYPEGVEPVAARVIAQSPTDWYSTIQIDKGTADGLEVDQPVVAGGGLVGKVTDATSGTATVTLVTDADSAVSAQVVPSGARGVVKPQVGNPEDLLLDFLDKDEKVEEGATVVTSGSTSSRFESLFPRGIPIGEVTRVDPDERELYQRVHIRPHAELQKLGFVQVLTGDAPVEAAGLAE
jgi:rod shape-determining protein MreC